MSLRKHQYEFQEFTKRIRDGGEPIRKITGRITPGGGKSVWPQIAARDLLGPKTRLLWVVPRLSLAEQGQVNFLEERYRLLLDHQIEIRQSTNDLDPCRGLPGFVTTYQAIASNPTVIAHELTRYDYIAVLDEPHHVLLGGIWHRRLVEAGIDESKLKLLVLMTGTLDRGDGKPAAFFDYDLSRNGRLFVARSGPGKHVIEYGRADAIAERAILQLEFQFHDSRGAIRYAVNGNHAEGVLSEADAYEASQVLGAALDTEYARELLGATVEDWQAYRRHHPWAQLLVVTRSQSAAKDALSWLKKMKVRAERAVSEETDEALRNIRSFKRGQIPCLVTVAMAYEGLDVEEITHIACLTNIRSAPWIEQMAARAARIYRGPEAPPWNAQRAVIHAPDDELMRQIWKRIKSDQERGVRESQTEKDHDSEGSAPSVTVGIDGHADTARAETDHYTYDRESAADYQQLAAEFGLPGVDAAAEFERRLADIKMQRDKREPAPRSTPTTVNERENALRKLIQKECSRLDYDTGEEGGAHNLLLFREFGKARKAMSVEELEQVWSWMQRYWGC